MTEKWCLYAVFFFNDTATTEIYTLSLHDALPISGPAGGRPRARDLGVPFDGTPGPLNAVSDVAGVEVGHVTLISGGDRKSTRLNSSHANISYAVFCLKKKTNLHITSYDRQHHHIH